MSIRAQDVIGLIIAVAVPLAVGAVGSIATSSSVTTWFPTLAKPPWNPPNWIFGPVWTLLYVLMGVAVWLVWRNGIDAPGRAAR